jgi:hypothetical protein
MIKIFSDSSPAKVEIEVNSFLTVHPRYKVVYSKYTHDSGKDYRCNLTIILEREQS